jgi:hypothetical protein
MKKYLLPSLTVLSAVMLLSSCKKDDTGGVSVKPYTVPTTYSFANASYTKVTQLTKMTVEIDAYLKTANAGTATVPLDQAKLNNMFANTGNPFSDAALNAASVNIKAATSDYDLYKGYADSVLIYNTGTAAAAGTGGFVPRGSNKIIVGPTGIEYGQAFLKSTMGALFFKEAVNLLTSVKTLSATDTLTAQAKWDEAFGYLSVPANYDTSVVYVNTDPNRPLLWGGYLRERGREIQAGGIIFGAFLKGRAAIGGYDVNVRNAQVDIILEKWEQLAARAAWVYVTMPTLSANVGNYGSQLHALSEGFGFIAGLKYRAANSKLSAANYATINNIIHKDFYVLLNQPGFTDLVTLQNLLQSTYGLQ